MALWELLRTETALKRSTAAVGLLDVDELLLSPLHHFDASLTSTPASPCAPYAKSFCSRTSLAPLPSRSRLTSSQDTRLSTHSLPLYHRIISLSSPLPPWSRRGVIHLDSHTSDAWLDENGISPSSLGAGERYQLGLGRHESTPLEELNVIIVDSVSFPLERTRKEKGADGGQCVLLHAPQTTFEETLVLAYTRAPTQELIHFRYITSTLEGCEKEPKGPLERAGGRVEVEVDRGVDAEPLSLFCAECGSGS